MQGYEAAFFVALGLSVVTTLLAFTLAKKQGGAKVVALMALLTTVALLVTLGWNIADSVEVQVTRS